MMANHLNAIEVHLNLIIWCVLYNILNSYYGNVYDIDSISIYLYIYVYICGCTYLVLSFNIYLVTAYCVLYTVVCVIPQWLTKQTWFVFPWELEPAWKNKHYKSDQINIEFKCMVSVLNEIRGCFDRMLSRREMYKCSSPLRRKSFTLHPDYKN